MEIFCGCARLSDLFEKLGLEAIRVDFSGNKDAPPRQWIRADLTTVAGQDVVWRMLESERVLFVHLGI